jgi:hypothetical protein
MPVINHNPLFQIRARVTVTVSGWWWYSFWKLLWHFIVQGQVSVKLVRLSIRAQNRGPGRTYISAPTVYNPVAGTGRLYAVACYHTRATGTRLWRFETRQLWKDVHVPVVTKYRDDISDSRPELESLQWQPFKICSKQKPCFCVVKSTQVSGDGVSFIWNFGWLSAVEVF